MASSEGQSLWQRPITIKPIYLAILILGIIILPIGFSIIYFELKLAPIFNYDPNMAKKHDVRAKLRIQHLNGTVHWINLIEDKYEKIDDPEQRITKLSYEFSNSQLRLNATFSLVELTIFVPEEGYEYFLEIEIEWHVENNAGYGKKSAGAFTYNGRDYVSELDITNVMWKDDVPDTVESKVTLYSR